MAGKYRFRLKASNGQIIAAGEGYESKASARNGIDLVKRHAPDTPPGNSGGWRSALVTARKPFRLAYRREPVAIRGSRTFMRASTIRLRVV